MNTNDVYEQEASPRTSLYTNSTDDSDFKSAIVKPVVTIPSLPPPPPPQPSIRLLFSLLSSRHLLLLLLPAISVSIISGGVAPFMTHVVGQVFDAFARYPLTPNPPPEAKHNLLHGVGIAALELLVLAVSSLLLSSLTSFLWIRIGETNAMQVRKAVYKAVTQKDIAWFDTKMGAADSAAPVQSAEGDGQSGPMGAGGLMAKFAR